ncbi:MAG: M20/M25/M40 family metallo-hydrolase [bacterium]|nr:M20/M25/M40 family metallo-hydrolase [bacterium]
MKMKEKTPVLKLIFSFFVLLVTLSLAAAPVSASDYPGDVLEAKASIKGRVLFSHVEFLASKYCRGRETGDWGLEVADQYITAILKSSGITPAGRSGSYSQPVKLKAVSLGKNISLKVETTSAGMNQVKNARLDWDYLPITISGESNVKAPVVFAGYGITAGEHKYDDYKDINASGKIVLVMRHEPGEKDSSSPFDGVKNSRYGTLMSKILNAQKHGAVGILFVADPVNHNDSSIMGGSFSSGTRWSSIRRERAKNDDDFKYRQFRPKIRIVGNDYGIRIPAVMIDGNLADHILGKNHSLQEIQRRIDKTRTPRSFSLAGKRVSMDIHFENQPVEAHNIVAKIEGSDPQLKNEVVIIGAHYDHEGIDKRGRLYGGADDNASGTAVVIETARAFMRLKKAPKRTLLFLLFTAEEKGLLGAHYYVRNPLFPLAKTIGLINLDMVGRNDTAQLSVIGKYQFPKFYKMVSDINQKSTQFDLNLSAEEFMKRSDHFPFLREGIPYIFFSSGTHDQYHRPEDTPRLVNVEKMERVAQLAFLSLWDVANLPAGAQLK